MKPAYIAQIVFIAAASLGVYSFVRAAQSDHTLTGCQALCQLRPAYAARDRRVPDLELPDMNGNKVKLSSYLGKGPVVLNFWTKTCKPCLEEMPALADLAQIVKKDGVQVVTICTDEGPEAVKDTLDVVLKGNPAPFPVLFDPDGDVLGEKFGTSLYPETWLIDQRGVIRARVDGPRDWSGAIALEVIENLERPGGCPVVFGAGKPSGRYAGLCGDL